MIKLFVKDGCPRCKVLETKLDTKNIEYEVTHDTTEVERLGFTILPVMEVGGEYFNFKDANNWITRM